MTSREVLKQLFFYNKMAFITQNISESTGKFFNPVDFFLSSLNLYRYCIIMPQCHLLQGSSAFILMPTSCHSLCLVKLHFTNTSPSHETVHSNSDYSLFLTITVSQTAALNMSHTFAIHHHLINFQPRLNKFVICVVLRLFYLRRSSTYIVP